MIFNYFKLYRVCITFAFLTLARATLLLTPSQDCWYTPFAGYENLPNGYVLKWRETPHDVVPQLLGVVAKSYQLLVKSNDDLNRPLAVSTTVLIPHNVDHKKIVSYHIAEDSSAVDCAPSYALQAGADPQGLIASVEFTMIQSVLNYGYILNIPDYEGPHAAFTVGQVAGRTVLDSLRGVLNSHVVCARHDARIALWGYSGGSIATGWAAQFHKSYAPELNVVGAAMGGVVPNISAVALQITNGPFAGLASAGIAGFTQQYDDVNQLVGVYMKPEYRGRWNQLKQHCLVPDLLKNLFRDPWCDMFTIGAGVLKLAPVAKRLEQNTMGHYVPDLPVYMYHAVHDQVAPVDAVDKLYRRWCKGGIKSLYYEKSLATEHLSEEPLGVPAAMKWVKQQLQHPGSVVSGCKMHTGILPWPKVHE